MRKRVRSKFTVSSEFLIFIVCFFITAFGNFGFFSKLLGAYPFAEVGTLAVGSVAVALFAILYIFLALVSFRILLKPALVVVLMVSAFVTYVTQAFGLVLDDTMILNAVKTDLAEIQDLLTSRFFLALFFVGVIPSAFVLYIQIPQLKVRTALLRRVRSVLVALLFLGIIGGSFGKFYASFFREHKELRSYVNPLYFFYSAAKYVGKSSNTHTVLAGVGRDSKIPTGDQARDLVIFIVGETARADHFSLNGYSKQTNPLLEKEDVISLTQMWACGTSTAISVPCMFSDFGRSGFTPQKAKNHENLLDVLVNTKKVNVLWRDNNSDSKGVALRVPYQDFKSPDLNPFCDGECRDEGMLHGLQDYISSQKSGDIFIVLHQMGNHGPAYYKRYPSEFEKFKPACRTSELANCSTEEISNAYDNALLYTDFFLSQVIQLLKENSAEFETTMMYVSDHGESLGEHGIYLHGLPYLIAPDAQKRPAALLWLGPSLNPRIDRAKLRRRAVTELSHDIIFHSVLGLFEVETEVYRPALDIFK